MNEEQIKWLKDNLTVEVKTSNSGWSRWLDVTLYVEGLAVSESSIKLSELKDE